MLSWWGEGGWGGGEIRELTQISARAILIYLFVVCLSNTILQKYSTRNIFN